jgi:N6-adenosine-specific RNA methylase IME4
MKKMIEIIPLSKIETRDTLQPRATMNFIIVEDYAQAMKEGQIFPPLDVVFDGETYWLWDGFHRCKAAEQIGLTEINIRVTEGDFEYAEWLALGANKTHGFRRSNEDKRRAVELALRHPRNEESINNGKLNFSFVSKHCGVSDMLVAKIYYEINPKQYADISIDTENSSRLSFQSKMKPTKTTRPPTAANIAPEVKAQLPLTDITDNPTEIAKLDKLSEDAQAEVVSMIIEGKAKTVKSAKKKIETAQQIEAIAQTTYPQGKYHVIVMDPPWKYDNRAKDITHRAANPYPDMTIEEIRGWEKDNGGIPALALDDCILWLWTTNAHVKQAHELAEAWGFEVKTILTWVKSKMGTGDWLRGKSEHCLMCIKGKPIINLTNQTTILNGPLREHSRKPDEFYKMVDELCPGKKIDIFSREQRKGWMTYGNEPKKFTETL